VDGHAVPAKHFGLILEWDEWQELADRLEKEGIDFIIEPCIRFEGKPGEQATMFFKDPSGNALEFKAFRNKDQIFAVE
jgi:extradiol dioxygenase family protein